MPYRCQTACLQMTDACIAEASFDLAPDVGMEDAAPKCPLWPHTIGSLVRNNARHLKAESESGWLQGHLSQNMLKRTKEREVA